MKLTLICLLLVLFASAIVGQEVVDRRIIAPPKATVPEEANKTGLGGTVRVLVEIDQAGNVLTIKDAQGPDWVCQSVTRPDVTALREAARAVAQNVKFAPVAEGDPFNSSVWLEVSFPSAAKSNESDGEERHFTAVPAAEENKTDTKQNSSGNVFTIKGDNGRSTVKGDLADGNGDNSSKDYAGPVRAAGSDADQYTLTGEKMPLPRSIVGSSLSGGVLNGKAIALPKPTYPPAARAVRASGAVTIQVLIEENGKIFSAQPVSGHPLLRSAARIAACGAEFSPTYLEGQPVKVSGVISYNFIP